MAQFPYYLVSGIKPSSVNLLGYNLLKFLFAFSYALVGNNLLFRYALLIVVFFIDRLYACNHPMVRALHGSLVEFLDIAHSSCGL